ncbi:MAG: hypothetical protein KGK10_02670, partial [Rhodospirillales bacterium]|nr:hypothetical protein [Rhodospirillales bacterium]
MVRTAGLALLLAAASWPAAAAEAGARPALIAPTHARVALREGRHRGYVRLVLRLPKGASASLSPAGVLVARGGDGLPLPLAVPDRRAPFPATRRGAGLRVALPAGAFVHSWRLGPRFIFDVRETANPPLPLPPQPPFAAPPGRLATLLPLPPAPPSRAPAGHAQTHLALARSMAPGAAGPARPALAKPSTVATPSPKPALVPVPPLPPTSTLPVASGTPPASARDPSAAVTAVTLRSPRRDIALPYAGDVPIAAFRRAGRLLLVADSRVVPPPRLLAQLHAKAAPLPAGMSLTMPPGLVPVVEHGAWHLVDGVTPPTLALRVARGQVSLAAAAPGPVISVRDPRGGGLLLVGTVASAGAVASRWRTPFFTVLPTLAGVAVAAHADAVQLRAIAGGFLLDGGAVPLPLGTYNAAAAATAGVRLLDLPDLGLAALRRRLTEATFTAASAPPLARADARLAAAQAMLALGMGAEAGSLLRLAANADVRLAADPRFQLAAAAAAALHPEPGADPVAVSDAPCRAANEVCLWRAVRLAAHAPDRAKAAAMFARVLPILEAYPRPLRRRLLPLAAETMLRGGKPGAAARLLAAYPRARSLRLARAIAAEAALPAVSAGSGGRGAAAREVDAVLARYDRLVRSRDRLLAFRAAFRAARLRAARGLATASQTAAALDRLRFAWRG